MTLSHGNDQVLYNFTSLVFLEIGDLTISVQLHAMINE
jgi:hypothetical protein